MTANERDYERQAEEQGALANRLRVENDLRAATLAMRRALLLHARGSQPRLLTAQLLEWAGCLSLDCRCFPEAAERADHALILRRSMADRGAVARTLVLRALVYGTEGHPRAANRLLMEAMDCVDAEAEPLMVAMLIHNMAWFLVDQGRASEALVILQDGDAAGLRVAERHGIRDRWLRARILGSPGGDPELAASELADIQEEFRGLGFPYDAALSGLELALCQGPRDALRTLADVRPIFRVLGIKREAVAAELLERAIEGGSLRRLIPRIALSVRTWPVRLSMRNRHG